MRIIWRKRKTLIDEITAILGLSREDLEADIKNSGIFDDFMEKLDILGKNVATLNTATRRIEQRQYRWFADKMPPDKEPSKEYPNPLAPARDNGDHPMPAAPSGLEYYDPKLP